MTAQTATPAVVAMATPDIEALHCESQIERLRAAVRDGASADRQIAIYRKALDAGKRRLTALKDVVDWAARETAAAMSSPDIRERTLKQGANPVGSTPAQFERFVRSEVERWTQIIRQAGITLE